MGAGYIREVYRARLYLAKHAGGGDVWHGMAMMDRYERACAFRALNVNIMICLCGFAPAIVTLSLGSSGVFFRLALVVGISVLAFVAAIDFARTFVNHEGWEWLWPRPEKPLQEAFAMLLCSGIAVGLDTIRIMCDPFGRRRCVPELRLDMAHRI
jgi:hypothetical protein